MWKKSRIFRVVVGGSISAHLKKVKKSEKMLGYIRYFSYISTVIMIDMNDIVWIDGVGYCKEVTVNGNVNEYHPIDSK